MSSTQNQVEALYTKLTSDNLLNTFCGGSAAAAGRIYHPQAPQNATLPHLVFALISNPLSRNFGGSITYATVVHFDLWVPIDSGTAGAAGAGTGEEALFALLDTFSMSPTGFDRGVVLFTDRGVREVIEDAILIQADAVIRGTTS